MLSPLYLGIRYLRAKRGYFREEELSERLGGILKDIYLPDSVVRDIERSLASDKSSRANQLQAEQVRLQKRLTGQTILHSRAYVGGREMRDNNILSGHIKPAGRQCGIGFVNWQCPNVAHMPLG